MLVDITKASEILDVNPGTLYQWVAQGKVPFVKMGRLVKFDPEKLREFIEENSRGVLK